MRTDYGKVYTENIMSKFLPHHRCFGHSSERDGGSERFDLWDLNLHHGPLHLLASDLPKRVKA
jgi:hypothetical protein